MADIQFPAWFSPACLAFASMMVLVQAFLLLICIVKLRRLVDDVRMDGIHFQNWFKTSAAEQQTAPETTGSLLLNRKIGGRTVDFMSDGTVSIENKGGDQYFIRVAKRAR